MFYIRIHSNAIRSNRPTNQPASQQTCICRVPLARTASGATCLLSKYKTSTIVMGCACVCLCVFFCDSFHSILFFYLYFELLIRLQIQSHTIWVVNTKRKQQNNKPYNIYSKCIRWIHRHIINTEADEYILSTRFVNMENEIERKTANRRNTRLQ